jgi:hypothetical protein
MYGCEPPVTDAVNPNEQYTNNVQLQHPYKTAGKIMALYVVIFIFLDSKLEDKRFCTKW